MARLVATPAAVRDPLLIVLLGPTASGKTSLSIRIARKFHGEVVSCDSVAVYRGFDIGSAKPTPAERSEAPHHLIDIVSPGQEYSAGAYSRDARRSIATITARGHQPIVTGGTGLYLRALLNGLFAGPAPLRRTARTPARHRINTRPLAVCMASSNASIPLPPPRSIPMTRRS